MRGLALATRGRLAWKALTATMDSETAAAAHGLLGGIFLGSPGPPPMRGTQELLSTVNSSPWVRAAGGRVGEAMSSVPWKLYVLKKGGRVISGRDVEYIQKGVKKERRQWLKDAANAEELIEVPTHLALEALRGGNAVMSGTELRWLISLWYDMVGDVFLITQRNIKNMPVSLWPVPPHWVVSTATPSKPFYEIRWKGWNVLIPDSEMLWLKNPNAVDPYGRGASLARSVDDEVTTDEYASKHELMFFKNKARPDVLIMPTAGKSFNEVEQQRFEDWWNEKLQGFWRAFKPLFLKVPVDVKVLEQNFRNMQLKELRDQMRDIIIQVWGVPPEMLGILTNSNRSTIDQAETIFARYCLEPRLERWREFFQQRLINQYAGGRALILDYDSPVPEDRFFQLNVMKVMPAAYELNEFRKLSGMAPDETLDGMHMNPSSLSFFDPEDPLGQAAIELARPPMQPGDNNTDASGNPQSPQKPKPKPAAALWDMSRLNLDDKVALRSLALKAGATEDAREIGDEVALEAAIKQVTGTTTRRLIRDDSGRPTAVVEERS